MLIHTCFGYTWGLSMGSSLVHLSKMFGVQQVAQCYFGSVSLSPLLSPPLPHIKLTQGHINTILIVVYQTAHITYLHWVNLSSRMLFGVQQVTQCHFKSLPPLSLTPPHSSCAHLTHIRSLSCCIIKHWSAHALHWLCIHVSKVLFESVSLPTLPQDLTETKSLNINTLHVSWLTCSFIPALGELVQ